MNPIPTTNLYFLKLLSGYSSVKATIKINKANIQIEQISIKYSFFIKWIVDFL
jgi:hypothetical protein